MRKNARVIIRVASGALVLVFVALLSFTILGATTIRRAAHATKSAVTLSQQYEYIERQLWKEASLVRVHGVNWQNSNWYANIYEEHAATQAIETTLNEIVDTGSAKDRELAGKALADHARYTEILRKLFAEIDSGTAGSAETFEQSTRLFDVMQAHIDRRAAEQHTVAITSLSELDRTQTRIVQLILLAALIGALLLAVSASIILRYRHLIEKSRSAELTRLAEVSLTDTLTGLGNHRAYQGELERELARSERHGGTVSLALIDVDNFKSVNDTKGHIQGDIVLSALGSLLRRLRKSDRGFRLGGDEFAIVLPHTEPADALATMDRLRQDAAAALEGSTISIGISSTLGHEIDAVTLRAQADAALYAAKHRGRNSVMTYADARSHEFVRSTEKERAIRALIDEGHLDVVFQPIWDVRKHAPLGFEALVRPAAKYGLAGPQEAFDLAEQMGLAPALDVVALRAIFARAGELPPDSLLFVNIVPETLASEHFMHDAFDEAIANAGLRPERIVIELTERSMLHLDLIVREAKRLQSLGFQLALDDTGAGNAGLDVLRNLSVEFVKIDRAVVLQAMTDPIARAIVTGIIEIARAMGSYVIAEGIETVDVLQFVCCHITHPATDHIAIGGAQGYLLGRPEGQPWNNSYIDSATLLRGQTQSTSCEPGLCAVAR